MIASEACHFLGVPTTRSAGLVGKYVQIDTNIRISTFRNSSDLSTYSLCLFLRDIVSNYYNIEHVNSK